ncbi:hypothetical protein [Hymenobacter negativus]|uniref:YtxH domain-containing protein n=1 Tax=Hymenobacter negativus TaxID=2795026 RepID=A0ABS3QFC5_9BACT|nr:hypothetical protein [Hymenobacter negativus]MBO2009928.1 hypothetical protein [Hymenobacter negativus]
MAFPYQLLLETVLPHLLMGKDKKKHSKKDRASEDILDVAAVSLKKFRKVTKELSKLSTGQKVVGGIALAAAGLVYLAAHESPVTSKPKGPADDPGLDEAPAHRHKPAGARHRKSAKSQAE